MNLQEMYPDNWKNHMRALHAYEKTAITMLKKARLMPTFTPAQELVFGLPGAVWQPTREIFEAARRAGWAEINPRTGNTLGQALTPAGWAERKRLYRKMKALCKKAEVGKEPGWEGVPGHMVVK